VGSVHKRALELLPWYVTGTLPEHERAEVESHLRGCLSCRAALREEQRMHVLVESQEDIPVSYEHGVADLLKKIDGAGARPPPVRRLALAATAVTVVAAVVAGWFALIRPDASVVQSGNGTFSTLSSSDATAPNRVDVVFEDGVSAGEIGAIIRSVDGRIIGGPSKLGRYTVSVPADTEDQLSAAIETLQKDPRVRFVGQSYVASPASVEGDE
jgi:anti-sigma factor RsiW